MISSKKRNRLFEEFLIDSTWKLRPDIKNYKIVAYPLDDNEYFYVFSGLLTNSSVLKPKDKRVNGSPIILFSNGNYSLTKKLFLDMIGLDDISAEYISNSETFKRIQLVYNEL